LIGHGLGSRWNGWTLTPKRPIGFINPEVKSSKKTSGSKGKT